MKKKFITIALTIILPFLLLAPCEAFLTDVKILDKIAISKLTDEALLDAYIEVMIEYEASTTFHSTAGFSNPKEYNKYKEMLKYRTYLILEIKKRELEIPQITP